MYHCHIRFYLAGAEKSIFDAIKTAEPLEHFTHEFCESRQLEEQYMPDADAVFACITEQDTAQALGILSRAKAGASLIVICRKEQADLLFKDAADEIAKAKIDDVWLCPMTPEEASFRFKKWQNSLKQEKDSWQTSQFLESTINYIPNLIWYKTKDGIHKKVNDSFCKIVNKSKEQVQGRGHAYIWDVEADDPACIESERKVMRERKTVVSDEVIKTGSETKIFITYKSPLYDLDGSIMGTAGVAIDVTKERSYKQKIMERTHMLESILESMDCGVICHSMDGKKIISINKSALEILGYESPEEMVLDKFDMVSTSVLKEDREKLLNNIKSLKKEGDSISSEYRVQMKDGRIRNVIGIAKLILENGNLLCHRLLLDCTAQKWQEEKERKYQHELIRALSTDYHLICHFNLDTETGIPVCIDEDISCRLGTELQGSLSLSKSMARYISEYVHDDDKQMMQNALSGGNLAQMLQEKNFYYVNYRLVHNGKTKYYQLKVVRIGEWEKKREIVLGFRTIDEMTQRELAIRSELESALQQANAANKAKTTFLSNMSHDIRTPMNAIIGFANLALSHAESREQTEDFLKKILSSGKHLLHLINNVLDMSYIESGKMQLDEKPCSIPDIIYALYDIIQTDAAAKHLELRMDADGIRNEDIFCDRLRLNQVLLNLLSNAVKYTPIGGKITFLTLEKPDAPHGYAHYEFCIKDTGIGMSKGFVSHIFEPFERENNSTVSGIQGTGLGMAITKNIISMMNGTISVKSEQGEGTEFTVSFQFRLNPQAKKPSVIEELKNRSALVVSSNSVISSSVSAMLQQFGMRAHQASSGAEAVTKAKHLAVAVIDSSLPDMDSREAAGKIKAETDGSALTVVLAEYGAESAEEKDGSITAFCTKPLFASRLHSCIHSAVSTAKNSGQSRSTQPEKIRSGRILLAEDNAMNQEIARMILTDAGFSCDIAENGQAALDMLKGSKPEQYQFILMDIQMPVMNGYESAKAIRALEDESLSRIPIIAMTANAFEEDKQEALKCGMNGHIAKPLDVKNLFTTLDAILSGI